MAVAIVVDTTAVIATIAWLMDGAGKELSDIEADVEVDSELQVVRASVASASLAIALSILA